MNDAPIVEEHSAMSHRPNPQAKRSMGIPTEASAYPVGSPERFGSSLPVLAEADERSRLDSSRGGRFVTVCGDFGVEANCSRGVHFRMASPSRGLSAAMDVINVID